MKKTTKIASILTFLMAGVCTNLSAQTSGERSSSRTELSGMDKAENNCTNEKMEARSNYDKVGAKIVPGIERIQRDAAARECARERAAAAISNRESEYKERYSGAAERSGIDR